METRFLTMKSNRTIKEKFRALLGKQEFNPGFLGVFTNPAYFGRKGIFEEIKYFSPHIKGKVLDIGCGTKPYKELFGSVEYIGLEIDTPPNRQNKSVDFFYDGSRFPFAEKEFDSAITTEVLECIPDPDAFIKEIRRVLKADGLLLLTAPFAWNEMPPNDYIRYTSFGIKNLLEKNGFVLIEQRKNLPDIRLIFQFINNYLRRKIKIRNDRLKLFVYIIVFGPLNILGSLCYKILPTDKDMYLNNIVLAKKQ